MPNYIGVKCPVCGKKFIQADDIVVCPVCGAPHHRECYSENSACAFVNDHLSGKEWRPPAPEAPPHVPYSNVTLCPSCKSLNPAGAVFCQSCARRLNETPPPAMTPGAQNFVSWTLSHPMIQPDTIPLVYGGLSPDEKIEGETVKDLAAYIGDNSAYYLPHFKSMEENSYTLSFNFSALVFNFLYFFYRRMYLIGALMLALYAVGLIPNFLLVREILPQWLEVLGIIPEAAVNQAAVDHYQSLINVTSLISFSIGLIVSLCANHFYYTKSVRTVRKIREIHGEARDELLYMRQLTKKGGTSKIAVIIVIFAITAATTAIYFAITYAVMGGLAL